MSRPEVKRFAFGQGFSTAFKAINEYFEKDSKDFSAITKHYKTLVFSYLLI